ncbi:peptidoglycan D,D-transpeptidase FtsI family protein [Nibricoccus sp. IMCC34717]|uniref:peptidoglycan D,D-transpeptidase FtsI family protein n=1 Tax=Nibricoccus sp. IMCC34717 TaxID=3034021 RepID=UPI00384FB784
MSRGFASNYRIVLLSGFIFLGFAGVATRLVFLHVINREELVQYVEKSRRQIVVENARRGDILDTHGDTLATSLNMIDLGVDPAALRPQDEAKWPELARLLELPLDKLTQILRTKTRPAQPDDLHPDDRLIRWARLKSEVPESVYRQIDALDIKGVYGPHIYRRVYPHKRLAAHLIGYVNKESVPTTGVERYADFYLRGQNGWRESEKDGRQRELAQFRTRDVPATDGFNVVLSIDAAIQSWVEEELDEIAKQFNPQRAVIIVSDARTGFLLALGNYPSFDLNDFSTAPLDVQRNYAITDQIDPGSTFKIVPAAGALNEGLVTPGTRFDCMTPVVDFKGKPRKLMVDDHRYDHLLSVAEIISHSSNRGAAQLGMKLGEQKLYEYARAFGFGRRTGFPFGGEISGSLNPPEKWSGVEITRIPAGYSISATPLQIHCAMAAIASGGEWRRPLLIREVRDNAGESIYRLGSSEGNRILKVDTALAMADMLQGVVSKEGTAPNAAIPGYQVAGKTGTAQKLINGRYSDRNHVGSFCGFFPASDPRVVITVIVDDGKVPNGSAYGRVVAAPSFKRVAERLIPYLDIKPIPEAGPRILAASATLP